MRNRGTTDPLNERANQKTPSPMEPRTPGAICFRLDEKSFRALAHRADRLGVSSHELARSYVLQLLEEAQERAAWRAAAAELHHALVDLREHLALSVEALLVTAGKVDKADARAWVDECFQ